MNRKPKNTDEPIATKYLEKEKQETERHDTNTLILASVVASLMFIFMSIINVYKHSPMLFSTVFGAVFLWRLPPQPGGPGEKAWELPLLR